MSLSRQYIAGFFDGEGCVSLTVKGRSRQVALRLMLVNTNRQILEMIQAEYGGRFSTLSRKPGWKVGYQLNLTDKAAYEFLLAVLPYLIVKKPQAKLAVTFYNYMHSEGRLEYGHGGRHSWKVRRKLETIARELEYKQLMHTLNRKGAAVQ